MPGWVFSQFGTLAPLKGTQPPLYDSDLMTHYFILIVAAVKGTGKRPGCQKMVVLVFIHVRHTHIGSIILIIFVVCTEIAACRTSVLHHVTPLRSKSRNAA
jgi:hypothetical protein